MTVTAAHPDLVGRYLVGDQSHFYAVRRIELDRSGIYAARVIASFCIAPGRFILTVSLTQEVVQFAPFEFGVQMLGMIGINADASPFDAGRVESVIRQFDVAAVCGLDAATLEGLAMMGHDAAAILKGRVVWARPDAYEAVAAMPGVIARRCAEIGPVLALECALGGGLHYDSREWEMTGEGEALRLTSRQQRLTPVRNLDPGVSGRTISEPCGCGSRDLRISLT